MAKLTVALRELGYRIDQVEWHHDPPLALRQWNEKTHDYDPPQGDPTYIRLLTKEEHKTQTHGRGGEKRATTADGDLYKIRRANRLAKDTEEFRARLLKPGKKSKKPPKRTPWGFRKRRK